MPRAPRPIVRLTESERALASAWVEQAYEVADYFARARDLDRDDCRSAANEALCSAVRGFNPSIGPFGLYLRRAVGNRCMGLLREKLRRSSVQLVTGEEEDVRGLEPVSPCPTPAQEAAKTDHWENLRRRIQALPPQQREVIERVYLRGRLLREVAEDRGRALGTVKSTLSRALRTLRKDRTLR